jgi:hypothetical protein
MAMSPKLFWKLAKPAIELAHKIEGWAADSVDEDSGQLKPNASPVKAVAPSTMLPVALIRNYCPISKTPWPKM